jgi:molybdenum cofactor synthesis domain-containing protein
MASQHSDTNTIITAGCVVIGDEILSGRTKEGNAAFLADALTGCAIDLKEIRIVSDEQDAIAEAVQTLSERYTYVFTSGGIGPTHDDITADAVAHAFGRGIDVDPRAVAIMAPHYEEKGYEFNDARKRMARIPEGADLIDNPISKAPGFRLENVHVMAGVPAIFKAMLENVLPTLKTGAQVFSRSFPTNKAEGTIGGPLGELQKRHPHISIGSYPRYREEGGFSVEIVLRGRDETQLDLAEVELTELLKD